MGTAQTVLINPYQHCARVPETMDHQGSEGRSVEIRVVQLIGGQCLHKHV